MQDGHATEKLVESTSTSNKQLHACEYIKHIMVWRGIVFCESPIVFQRKCKKKQTQMKRPLLNFTSLILRLSHIILYSILEYKTSSNELFFL